MTATFGDTRLPARFWVKVQVDEESGCWVWTASKRSGYGKFRHGEKLEGAHRVAYSAFVGPVPPGSSGKNIDHLCRVRACVNPAHLEIVTIRVNLARARASIASRLMTGRCLRGHRAWVPDSGRGGSFRCGECGRQARHRASVVQNALIRDAAKAAGLSKRQYGKKYGWSRKAALAVVAEHKTEDQ